MNCSDDAVALEGVDGCVRIGTDRARDGEPFDGRLHVDAWEALVAAVSR